MRSIGGYFGLELRKGQEYHSDCIALNTARNALGLLLLNETYDRVWLPYYICEDILEPILKQGIKCEFYDIDSNLDPIVPDVKDNDLFVVVNYFGLKDSVADSYKVRFKNVVIDDTQAFYHKTLDDAFYSCRKFFGVPDGAYLHTTKELNVNLKASSSGCRMSHLLKRIECGAEKGFLLFKASEESLIEQPLKGMSALTKAILKNIDYEYCAKARLANYNYIHAQLKDMNELKSIELSNTNVPMAYPFLLKSDALRKKLIDNKIFVATYWDNKSFPFKSGSWEEYLAKYLVPLPIDQRYGMDEMDMILGVCYEI
jgi:hypothetical protein